MFRALREDSCHAPPAVSPRPGPESRSVTLLRLARLFASVDGAVACGRYEQLHEMIGRISLALTMAQRAHKNAPAELHDADPPSTLPRFALRPR